MGRIRSKMVVFVFAGVILGTSSVLAGPLLLADAAIEKNSGHGLVDCSKPVQKQLPVSERDYSESDVVEYMQKYVGRIQQKIENNWLIPMRKLSDFQCKVFVRQREDGCVLQAAVQSCNGKFELIKSVMSAVRRSSPLPRAESRELFESDIVLTFHRDKVE